MLKTIPSALAVLLLASPAAAHEVWLERDGAGPARVYLGEPAEPVPPGGDPEFAKLKTPVVFTASQDKPAALTRKADHLEAAVSGPGDVRLVDSSVFAPWKGNKGALEGAMFHARAGRSETRTALDLEITPLAPNGDAFVVAYKGKPLADASVMLINPERWSKSFKTDAAGKVTVPTTWDGRYLLAINHTADEPGKVQGQDVTKVHHVSTLTFVK